MRRVLQITIVRKLCNILTGCQRVILSLVISLMVSWGTAFFPGNLTNAQQTVQFPQQIALSILYVFTNHYIIPSLTGVTVDVCGI